MLGRIANCRPRQHPRDSNCRVVELDKWVNAEWEVYTRYGPPGEDWPCFRPTAGETAAPKPKGQNRDYSRASQREANKKMKKNEMEAKKDEILMGKNFAKVRWCIVDGSLCGVV